MNTLAGIDLGTTYSALAVLNELGKPEIIPVLNANRIVPSIVGFSSATSAIVGIEAKNLLATDANNVVQFVKRKMGDPSHNFVVFGKKYSPIDISSFILKKLKDECIQNGEIRDVVITVPAHFDEIQRKSTMDAGTIAGLNVLGIVNEPTAAALFYSSITEINGNVVVYDLGGGTFDITVLEINNGEVDIKTSKGDGYLGGVDFDHEIVKFIVDEHKKSNGVNLFPDTLPQRQSGMDKWLDENKETTPLYYKLMAEAEKAKKTLSIRPKADIRIFTEKGNVSVSLTREKFEELISTFIATTEMLLENALEDAKLRPSEIKKVLLVGGSTRIPAIQKSIETIFGFPPEKAVNVDEAVALGAAISAGMKKITHGGKNTVSAAIRQELAKTRLLEVCNKHFGTLAFSYDEILGRKELRNSIILAKNTTIPCSKTESFYTIIDGQKEIKIEVTECEEEEYDKENVKCIGKFTLELPPNTPKQSLVKITYSYDENQRLHCSVQIPGGSVYETDIGYDDNGNLRQSEIKQKAAALNNFIVE